MCWKSFGTFPTAPVCEAFSGVLVIRAGDCIYRGQRAPNPRCVESVEVPEEEETLLSKKVCRI